MQEVLDQIYQGHRQNLTYGRRHLVEKRKKEELTVKSLTGRNNKNRIHDFYGKSLNLTEEKREKVSNDRSQRLKNPRFISQEDKMIMKKYNKEYDDVSIKLPRIKNSISVASNSTKMDEASEITSNSFESSRMNFSIRKQRIRRTDSKLKNQKIGKKFRKCVNAVIFLIRLKKKKKENIVRYSTTVKLSSNLLKIIDKQINKYYVQALSQPLLNFQNILEKKLTTKNYAPVEHIVNNIVDFSQKLAKSSIRRDILDFLTLISLTNAYVPVDYFCEFQILRLNFHPSTQQIGKVSDQQLQMMVGVFMGIKLLSMHIFYQPWNVRIFQLNIQENQKKLRPIIFGYGSFFYWCIIELYQDLPAKNYRFLEKMIKRGWEPMILQEESNQFFETFKKTNKKKYSIVIKNLREWIQKISIAVIRNRDKFSN